MDSTELVKPHRFFDRFLNNDLELLKNDILDYEKKLISNEIADIPDEVLKFELENYWSPGTTLGDYYNIFKFDNPQIQNIRVALRDAIKEASEYYGYPFEHQRFMVHGWFNVTYRKKPKNPTGANNYHDHMHGQGAPVFHGYYCVNAEPSSTWYKINGDDDSVFENVNINNRLVVSETGHPHGVGGWEFDEPRITIAYDVAPVNSSVTIGEHWIDL